MDHKQILEDDARKFQKPIKYGQKRIQKRTFDQVAPEVNTQPQIEPPVEKKQRKSPKKRRHIVPRSKTPILRPTALHT